MSDRADDRVKSLSEQLGEFADKVSAESEKLDRVAKNELRAHRVLSSVFAVLGVASPTILAMYKDSPSSGWVMLGIVLAASTGAWSAVSAINQWNERFKMNSVAASELYLLAADTRKIAGEISSGGDQVDNYRALRNALDDLNVRYKNIHRGHAEGLRAILDRSEADLASKPTHSAQAPGR